MFALCRIDHLEPHAAATFLDVCIELVRGGVSQASAIAFAEPCAQTVDFRAAYDRQKSEPSTALNCWVGQGHASSRGLNFIAFLQKHVRRSGMCIRHPTSRIASTFPRRDVSL